jgi:protein TonB
MFNAGKRLVWWACLFSAGAMFGQDAPKKLSKAEAIGAVASKTAPEYPMVARQLKLEGTVEIEAMISEQGTVEEVKVVSGNPVLTKAASEAVKKWKFTPVLVGGKPVKAVAPLTINFKL